MDIGGRRRNELFISAAWIAAAVTSLIFADFRVARLLRYSAFEVCDYVNHYVCHCGNCWSHLMKTAEIIDHALINLALTLLSPVALVWLVGSVAAKSWKRTRPS